MPAIFKWSGCLVFKCHSKTGSFDICTTSHHPNSGLVRYSDPYCIRKCTTRFGWFRFSRLWGHLHKWAQAILVKRPSLLSKHTLGIWIPDKSGIQVMALFPVVEWFRFGCCLKTRWFNYLIGLKEHPKTELIKFKFLLKLLVFKSPRYCND